MARFVLPTTTDPFQRMTVRLDGRDYVLTLLYNQREDRWYISIADDESLPLLSGLKLQANWPLFWRHRYNSALPPGDIMAVSTSDNLPPSLSDLGEGKRCELIYFDNAELVLLAAEAG
jgi:hypothetical protein